MKRLEQLISALIWLLVAGSVIVLTGGLFGRPLLLAAVPTGSMVPVLRPGDLIVVLPTWALHPPGLGDIVVFRSPDRREWIVHRIVDGNGVEGFVTRGDANPVADPGRVLPRDVAAVVPQVGGAALHLPRLGFLSVGQGSFTSPVVAGVALVMGVYLLVLDVRPRVRMPRFRWRRSTRARPQAVLYLYLGLAGTAFLTTLIPAWTLSSQSYLGFQVVAQKSSNVQQAGLYAVGGPGAEDVPIQNPSPVPILVVFDVDSDKVAYNPSWALIAPRGEHRFTVTVDTSEAGKFQTEERLGVFVPMMPPGLLAVMAQRNMALAAVVNAIVPAGLVFVFAWFDARSRLVMANLRMRLITRFL